MITEIRMHYIPNQPFPQLPSPFIPNQNINRETTMCIVLHCQENINVYCHIFHQFFPKVGPSCV